VEELIVDSVKKEEDNKEVVLILPKLNLVESEDNRELCEKVFNFFSTVPQGMTKFQIQHFVLSDMEFPTPDSKWWQAKLELWVRLTNVIQMHYDYRKRIAKRKELTARIQEYHYKGVHAENTFQRDKYAAIAERLQIEIEENEFAMMNIKKTINDKLKEMQAFWKTMQSLKEKLKFPTDNKELQEEEFWHAKARIDPRLVQRFPETFGGRQWQEKHHPR
jgi:hypothetical protein